MLVYQSKLNDGQYKALFEFLNSNFLTGGIKNVFPIFEG